MKIRYKKWVNNTIIFLIIIFLFYVIIYIILPKSLVQFFPGTQLISKITAKNYVNAIDKNDEIIDTRLEFANVMAVVTFKDSEYDDLHFKVSVEPKSFEVYCDTIKESIMDYYLHQYLKDYMETNFSEVDSYELAIGGDGEKWDKNIDYKTFYKNLDIKDINKYFKPNVCNLVIKLKADNEKNEEVFKTNCENKARELQKFLQSRGFKLGSIRFDYTASRYLPGLISFDK